MTNIRATTNIITFILWIIKYPTWKIESKKGKTGTLYILKRKGAEVTFINPN